MQQHSLWRTCSYAGINLAFFAFSLVGHWLFGWFAFVQEQAEHGQPVEISSYVVEMLRGTFENWQSEFLQQLWQVGDPEVASFPLNSSVMRDLSG
ncbi:DUF6766 family protein [Neorhizobium sp. DT-125]|uniref:DUF6766 family protein n=1 Tax=Neorhizobium sp. DT-125 TaxID=3396163 RepID=UPI003F1B1E45